MGGPALVLTDCSQFLWFPRDCRTFTIHWMAVLLLLFLLIIMAACCIWHHWREARTPVLPKHRPVRHEPLWLEVDAQDSAKLERWPGRCASCGCQCGHKPSWIPRSGVVVVCEATRDHMMSPGDVIVQLGAGRGRPLNRKEQLDQVLDD